MNEATLQSGNGQVTDCQNVNLPMPREFNGKLYYGAADVAKILGVTKKTVWQWQNTLYMGAPIFTADARAHDGRYLYEVERVMQLKSVYHPKWTRGGYEPSPTTYEQSQQQQLANLPHELLNQMRFVPASVVNGKKVFFIKNWNDPKNQTYAEDALHHAAQMCDRPFAAFDTSGHGQRLDYALIDLDNVRDPDTGEFTNPDAEKWFNYLQGEFEGYYVELSQSHRGFHFVCRLTPGKFDTIKNTTRGGGLLTFSEEPKVQLEVSYKMDTKACHLTGDIFGCEPNAPILEGEVADNVIEQLLKEIQKHSPKKGTAAKPRRDGNATLPADIQELVDRERKLIGMDELKTKGYLQHSENGASEPNGFICPDCGSGTHEHRSGALTWYDDDLDPHFVCHVCGFGGDVFTFLSRQYGIANSGAEFFKLIRHIADNFSITYDPKIFERHADEIARNLFADKSTSDLANAERLAILFGDQLRYVQDADEWLTYDGGLWTRSGDSRNSYLMPFVTRAAKIIRSKAQESDEYKIAACFENTRKASGAITFLKGIDSVIVTERDLDAHHELLNVGNGVIDLTDGTLLQADPKLLFTRQAPAIYRGIDYRDPDNYVENFLRSILPDDATLAAVIRYLGYALFGIVRDHVAQFWRGDGRNGKTTLLNLLLAVLGSYAVQLAHAAILLSGKPQDPNQATTALNPLDGARLALIDELPQNARLDVTLLKQLTGGGTIAIRQLHREAKNIIARAKLIINCGQYLPRLDNVDDLGLKERLRNVPFKQSFTGTRADPLLMAKLTTPESLSAMLSLLVQGAVAWYQHGLLESADMKQAKTAYLESNDFLREFFDENCVFAADKFIPRKKLLPRIREQYPAQVMRLFGNSDNALTEAVAKIDGISYRRGTGGARIFDGVGWQEDDFGGTPISSADYRP